VHQFYFTYCCLWWCGLSFRCSFDYTAMYVAMTLFADLDPSCTRLDDSTSNWLPLETPMTLRPEEPLKGFAIYQNTRMDKSTISNIGTGTGTVQRHTRRWGWWWWCTSIWRGTSGCCRWRCIDRQSLGNLFEQIWSHLSYICGSSLACAAMIGLIRVDGFMCLTDYVKSWSDEGRDQWFCVDHDHVLSTL